MLKTLKKRDLNKKRKKRLLHLWLQLHDRMTSLLRITLPLCYSCVVVTLADSVGIEPKHCTTVRKICTFRLLWRTVTH